MRWLALLVLKLRAAYIESVAEYHQAEASAAEDRVAMHAQRWNALYDRLQSVRSRIAALESPQVMLRQALRGSRVRL